jgi:hypothetical protein
MIFTNYPFLIFCLFLVSIALQYVRYRQIAAKKFSVSGLLLIKIVIRSLVFVFFLIASKAILNQSGNQNLSRQRALFVIKTFSPFNYNLSEDDQINLITRTPAHQYGHIEICLFNPATKQFFQFIPPTSPKAFFHLIKIERPFKRNLQRVDNPAFLLLRPINRIEFYEYSNHEWELNESNQDNFNLFEFLSEENSKLSPFLLHYLLILILSLLCLDIGIKYRILKI